MAEEPKVVGETELSEEQIQKLVEAYEASYEMTTAAKKAEVDKAKAEAEKAKADAAYARAQARKELVAAKKAEIDLERDLDKRDIELVSNDHQHVFYFTQTVNESSVAACRDTLLRWSRLDPDEPCDIEIVFDSPGGSVIDGMHLYDTIIDLRTRGHHITTTALGMAASMAGILLQAGTVRRMGAEAYILIHEISTLAGGKTSELEDEVAFCKRIQERVLSIFEERSQASGCEKPLTKRQFRNHWTRKDWWLDSDEAEKHGIVDEVLPSVSAPKVKRKKRA